MEFHFGDLYIENEHEVSLQKIIIARLNISVSGQQGYDQNIYEVHVAFDIGQVNHEWSNCKRPQTLTFLFTTCVLPRNLVIELINNSQGLNLIKILTHFFSALLVMIIYFPCTCSQQVTFGNRRLTPPFDLIILLQLMMEGQKISTFVRRD